MGRGGCGRTNKNQRRDRVIKHLEEVLANPEKMISKWKGLTPEEQKSKIASIHLEITRIRNNMMGKATVLSNPTM